MNIIRAQHLGMCFGVRDALTLALEEGRRRPLTILGELVHNESILAQLEREGVEIETDLDRVTTASVMVTAHGASERARNQVRARGLDLLEATCPLVQVAHRALAELVAAGYYPVVVGKAGHVEVRGLIGDLAEFSLVLSEGEIGALPERLRYGVVAQTTQPIDRVRRLVQALRDRFPRAEVRFADTVCQPTKQRQNAAIELAQVCDTVVVIGGTHSNNTRELAETCRRYCERVYHVQNAADLRAEWFAGARTVGITAGTSTPDPVIDEVEAWLRRPGAGARANGNETRHASEMVGC